MNRNSPECWHTSTQTGRRAVGTTTSEATSVTVSGTGLSSGAATLYDDYSWARAGASPSDGNNTYTAIASDSYGRSDTDNVAVYLPGSASYTYDDNGNLTSDGYRAFSYDDENQLITVWVTNDWKSEFEYDGQMRRRVRKEYTWASSSWVLTAEVRYVYDGNLVIQERDGNNLPKITYTRGTDLSGSMQGAGGIGGLLAKTDHSQSSIYSTVLYHADGNGNITSLASTNGILLGRYQYDPFGNTLSINGAAAEANLYRFSSKEYHPNSGLVYYLYRYYDSNLQRWINRDPIGELGGINLYQFVDNEPVNAVDPFGLQSNVIGIPAMIAAGYSAADIAAIAGISEAAAAALIAAYAAERACERRENNPKKDPCKGLRDQLEAHIKKLRDYIKDPDSMDNKGILKDPEYRERIINGRIKSLQKQIENFGKQLEDCEKANK